jgi:hypothetical protein
MGSYFLFRYQEDFGCLINSACPLPRGLQSPASVGQYRSRLHCQVASGLPSITNDRTEDNGKASQQNRQATSALGKVGSATATNVKHNKDWFVQISFNSGDHGRQTN